MRFIIISFLVFASCRNDKAPQSDSAIAFKLPDTSLSLADRNIKAAERNGRILDNLLESIKYMGTRDSFVFEAQKLEVLYYKTGQDKYRIRHNKLVDSVQKYCAIIHSRLN